MFQNRYNEIKIKNEDRQNAFLFKLTGTAEIFYYVDLHRKSFLSKRWLLSSNIVLKRQNEPVQW